MGAKKIKDAARPRLVLDTNVLVSALLFYGPPNRLVSLWQEGQVIILVSKDVLLEYLKVLSYPKFRLSVEEIRQTIEENLLPFIETVCPGSHPAMVREDPADDKFLYLAVDGHADFLLSGDKHLLSLGKYGGARILTTREFLELLDKS